MYNETRVKIIGGITLMFATILCFLFLLGEWPYFKFLGAVDDQKISNFFTSLEAMCFIATLFFASWQLEEARLARIASHKPNLRPSEYVFTWKNLTPGEIELTYLMKEADRGYYVSKTIRENTFELKNSGTNVANDIKCEWNYDTTLVSEIIKKEHETELTIDNYKENKESSFAIIEPGETVNALLCRYYLLMWSGEKSFLNFTLGNRPVYPPLSLNISFSDITGNRYSEKYLASVSYYMDDSLTMDFKRVIKKSLYSRFVIWLDSWL
ncbi:hypothetical protein [Dyadobacter sp. LHD-138]|uniref:hypothetical protein n=1 Tax=Dyadobacter sp. LHD-138 TaxID=3071413 RepID=UPI0027E10421|nr:hypothetical protein [Dyadobacter sp. LHD-138]MDQ6479792.1 hypothetical protein [Dyadobacter sp. LHD-138]